MPTAVPEGRSSPETFLRLIEKSKRGRLKMYIGHAAGVGKTYQMLEDAHALPAKGADVVVGVVETHGRAETAAKARGTAGAFPAGGSTTRTATSRRWTFPPSSSGSPRSFSSTSSRTRTCPGVENEKRYQDVEEILAAGISVMTTVNIQHFESVQEIVSRVTHVEVRERVPDRVLRQADAIVNVDLPSGGAARAPEGGKDLSDGTGAGGARELLPRGEPRLAARAGDAADRRPARSGAARARSTRARPRPWATR